MKETIKNVVMILLAVWCATVHMLLASSISFLHIADDTIVRQEEQIQSLQVKIADLDQVVISKQNEIEDLNTEISILEEDIVSLENEIQSICELSSLRESCANLTPAEVTALRRIAMAEAGNQGVIGKALVMLTVINRTEHPTKFSNSIEQNILSGAYTVTQPGGGYWTCKPDWECDVALFLVVHGWDESMLCEEHGVDEYLKVIYFTNQGYSAYGEKMFQHRNHYFSGLIF